MIFGNAKFPIFSWKKETSIFVITKPTAIPIARTKAKIGPAGVEWINMKPEPRTAIFKK